MAKKKEKPFLGRWRITWMEQWDQNFVDEEEQSYIEFEKVNLGQFHFGYVHGHMDCHLTTRVGKPAIEFSWKGNDEMDHALGRGWATAEGDQNRRHAFLSRRRLVGVPSEAEVEDEEVALLEPEGVAHE